MLQVAVHCNDDIADSLIETSSQRRRLPEVSPKPNADDSRIEIADFAQQLMRPIIAAVVHEHQFVIIQAFHHARQSAVQLRQVVFFVVEWNYD